MATMEDFIFEDEPGHGTLADTHPADPARPGAPAPESGTGVTPIAELKPVAELLRALARTIKMLRLYPDKNPVAARAVEELAERFTVAFQQHDSLRFLMGQHRIECQGESVYECSDVEESVARHFFRDGVREIAFHLGFDRAELDRFMELYRRALSRDEPEDMVTLLWDAALPHVTYIAVDEMLDSDSDGATLPEEFGSEQANALDYELDLMEPEEEGAGSEAARQAAAAASEMQRKLRRASESAILSITPEEAGLLAADVRGEDNALLARRVLDTLFEVLRLDSEPVTRQAVFPALENALTSLAARRQFGAVAHILMRLDEALARDPDLPRLHGGFVEAMHRAALEVAHLDFVSDILEKGTRQEQDELEEFFAVLPGGSVEVLIDLLGRVTSPRAQRQLAQALDRLAPREAAGLIEHLDDERPHVLVALLRILSRLSDPATVRALRPLTLHADVRVRQEALAALTRLGEAEARQALVNALRDTDPRMRSSAARTLGGLGAVGVNPLLQVILARDFESRRLEERRAFFDALGQTGSPEILPFLRHLLDKKPLFQKEKAEELRVCAVEALARMTLPAAATLMEEALKDPSGRVRGAAAAALRRNRTGQDLSEDADAA